MEKWYRCTTTTRPGNTPTRSAVSKAARNDCLCKDELKDNLEISTLIESFLKQIKNMLFLDVADNLGAGINPDDACGKRIAVQTATVQDTKELPARRLAACRSGESRRLKGPAS